MNFKSIFNNTNNVKPMQYDDEDFDFSESVMENMANMEDSFYLINRDHLQATHLSIKDGNDDILQEGLKDMMNSTVKFFKDMLEKFKEFMRKVFLYFASYIGNFEKFITKHKDELMKANPNFEITGHSYSFSDSSPNLDKVEKIIQEFNSEVKTLDTLTKEMIVKEREETLSTQAMDELRSHVLQSSNHGIPMNEFMADVKKSFRDGVDEKNTFTVSKSILQDSLNEFGKLKNVLKATSKQRDKTILLLTNLQNFFNNGAYVHYDNQKKVIRANGLSVNKDGNGIKKEEGSDFKNDPQTLSTANMYYNYKFRQAKELTGICTLVLTEKVSALKEALKLHETIIRRSIFNSEKEEGVNE